MASREQLLAQLEAERRQRNSFFGVASPFRYLPGELLNVIKSPIKSLKQAPREFERQVAKPLVSGGKQFFTETKFGRDLIAALKRPLEEGSSFREYLNTGQGKALLKAADVADIVTSRIPAGIIREKDIIAGTKRGIQDPQTNLFNLLKEGGEKRGLSASGIIFGGIAELIAPGPEDFGAASKLSRASRRTFDIANDIAKQRPSISRFVPTTDDIPLPRGGKGTTFLSTNPITREVTFNPNRFNEVVEDVFSGKKAKIDLPDATVTIARRGNEGRASISRRILNTVLDAQENRIRDFSIGTSGRRAAAKIDLEGLEPPARGQEPEPLSIRTFARASTGGKFPRTRVETKAADAGYRTADDIAAIRSQSRAPVSDRQAQASARQLGIDADQVLRMPSRPLTKEERFAVGGVVKDQLDQLRAIEDRLYRFPSDSPEGTKLRAQFAEQKIKTLKLLAKERAFASEAGRTLRAERAVFEGITEQEQRIAKFLNDPKVPQDSKDFVLDKVRDFAGSPKQMENLLRKMNRSSLTEWIVEFATAAKLWAIPTHIVNTLTSFTRLLTQIPIRALAGGMDTTIGKLYGGKKERFINDALAEAQGQWMGWKTSGHHAINALIDEEYTLKVRKAKDFYGSRGPAIKGRLGKETYLDSFLDWFGQAVRLPFRMLGVEDAIVRAPAEMGYLYTLAGRTAIRKGHKVGTEGYNKFVADFVLNPTADALEEAATQGGDMVLFQRELSPALSEVNRLRHAIPSSKLVVPFFRTLADLIKQFIEFTPAAPILLPSTRAALRSRGPAMDAISKMTLGTTVLVPLTMWVMEDEDRVTLGAPQNPADKDAFYASGKQPYSIRIGDKYYPFNRFSPFAEFVVAAKILSTAVKNDEEKKIQEVVTDAFFSMSTNLLDKTFAIGMRDALNALTDPESGRSKRFVHGLITGIFVPTIVSRAATAIDPTIYETNTLGEAFMAKLPYMTGRLNPRTDVFGEDLVRPSTGLVRFLSPVVPSKIKLDTVRGELEEVGYKIGFPEKSAFGGEISDDQYRELKTISGRAIYNTLFELVTDPEWDRLTPAEKEKTIDRVVDKTREFTKLKVAKEQFVIREIKNRLIKKFGLSKAEADKKALEVWENMQGDKAATKSEEGSQRYSAELDTPPVPNRPQFVQPQGGSLEARLLEQGQ